MEPDLSDQFESIGHFISTLLIQKQREEEFDRDINREKRQVSARIPMHAYEKLVEVAAEVGETPTGLAAALLELAIYEADGVSLAPTKESE